MSAEQVEYVCPQCRKRTVVNSKPGEEESVFCPRCEIDMKIYVKTSEVASAAANAPTSSGGVLVAAKATKTKTTKAKTARKTAVPKDPTQTKAAKAKAARLAIKAAAAVIPPQPDFGDFRCLCCGFLKTVPLGSEKPSGGWRCPACFVKLAWLRS